MRNLVRRRSRRELPLAGFAFPPPQSYDLVCFPIIDWNFRLQRPQHLLNHFARDAYRIFYVHTTFHPSTPPAYIKQLNEGIYRVRLRGPARQDTVFKGEITPAMLEELMAGLGELRSRAAIKNAICLVDWPFWSQLALTARQRWGWKLVYDCLDDHSEDAVTNPGLLRHEGTLIKEADLITASTQTLYRKVSRLTRKGLWIPNASEFEHFNRPSPQRPLSHLQGPIIGYYGAISHWFDVGMVREAASARPNWQFVIIGKRTGSDVSTIQHLKNVHLLGEKNYAALPSYLQQFDVACIPFLSTPLTEAADPVKFYEYLSAGKPVVAVDLPELRPHRDYFYLAHSGAEFITQVEKALREQSPERVEARVNFARQNTWADRYKTLRKALEQL
jgi:glycosyltransferase involved in cell wall biosynthesis